MLMCWLAARGCVQVLIVCDQHLHLVISHVLSDDRLRAGWLNSGRGTARVQDAQGTPTQSHVSPIILVYEDNSQVDIPGSWYKSDNFGKRRARRQSYRVTSLIRKRLLLGTYSRLMPRALWGS